MAELKVAKLGNPILRQIAKPVDLEDLKDPNSELQTFIDDLIETMRVGDGVGLAAPQVSRSVQIVVIECLNNQRYPGKDDIPLTVLVNPLITQSSDDTQWGWESCLSLIDFRGYVERSASVTVEAFTRKAEKIVLDASGFPAVVLQHEIDHLNGTVFIDRMKDFSKLAYQEEFETYWREEQPVEAEPN